jgi:undecaprenyl-diphosphatase
MAVVLAALGVLATCSALVWDQQLLLGEVAILEAVNGWPRWVGAPLEVVMQLGSLAGAGLVLVAVAIATLRDEWRPTLAVALAIGAAVVLPDVVKELVERPRPDELVPGLVVVREPGAHGYGFPSGHTTTAVALAAVLHPLLPARFRWFAWSLAAATGVARMYVGVHWPMDLVGGMALGIAIGAAGSLLIGNRYRRSAA